MALKELLVHLDQTEAATVRLRLAMELACQHDSRLTALFVDEWNVAQSDRKPNPALACDASKASQRLRQDLESFHKSRGLEFEWHYAREFSEVAVKQAAAYADLCILGHDGTSNFSPADRAFCANVVSAIGTPVLLIPKSTRAGTLGRRIVVAWDASRAAARALNDALPLIEQSDHTTVVNVDSGMHQQSMAGLKRLAERLARHGTQADALQIEALPSRSIGDVLQAKAHELGADLVVAGAYGHARAAENIFGGVTRDLLERTQLPLLLSH